MKIDVEKFVETFGITDSLHKFRLYAESTEKSKYISSGHLITFINELIKRTRKRICLVHFHDLGTNFDQLVHGDIEYYSLFDTSTEGIILNIKNMQQIISSKKCEIAVIYGFEAVYPLLAYNIELIEFCTLKISQLNQSTIIFSPVDQRISDVKYRTVFLNFGFEEVRLSFQKLDRR